jgi:hypothetical protein
VALGSGRSCVNTAAVPDVEMIKTTLAGGTVEREIICAGLSEHRTPVVYSAVEFTKGCVWGAAGPENLPAAWQGWHSGRKERLRSNPQTMDRDPDRGCRLSRHKRHRKQRTANHPHWPGLGGSALPDPPRFIALAPIPENKSRNGTSREYDSGVPSPVLAPGAALGSRLRVALSSGQVTGHVIRNQRTEPLAVRTPRAQDLSLLPSLTAQPRESPDERNQRHGGRVLSQTACSGRVIRDPGRSSSGQPSIFGGNLRNLRSRAARR